MLEAEKLVLALAFLLPIACISPLPDGAGAPRWALLCLVPFFAKIDGFSSKIGIFPLFFAGFSLVWSPDPVYGSMLAFHFVLLALVIMLAPKNLTQIVWAMGFGLALNAVVVAIQLAGFQPVKHVDGQPYAGLFFNRNQQNDLTAMVIVGLLCLRGWRALLLAAWISLPLWAPPVGRTPLVALAVAGAFALPRWWRIAALVGAGLAFFILAADPARITSGLQRLDTWTDAAGNLTILGHGLGSFRWAYPEMEWAHNDFLQISYELGLVGAAVIAALVWIAVRAPLMPRLVLIVFLVEGLFDFPLYWPTTGFMAALCLGAALLARAELRDGVSVRERARHARKVASRSA